MIVDTQVIHQQIVDGNKIRNYQVESVPPGMCGSINILSEVQTVQYFNVLGCQGGGGIVNVDVQVATSRCVKTSLATFSSSASDGMGH